MLDRLCKIGDRRVGCHDPGHERDSSLPRPGDHLDTDDGISPESKEVIGDSDFSVLQKRGPDVRQCVLGFGPRRDASLLRCGGLGGVRQS